jgi:hypothetical protein
LIQPYSHRSARGQHSSGRGCNRSASCVGCQSKACKSGRKYYKLPYVRHSA